MAQGKLGKKEGIGLPSHLLEDATIQALMAEGYREMAEENRRRAEQAFPLVDEMVRRYSRWEDA